MKEPKEEGFAQYRNWTIVNFLVSAAPRRKSVINIRLRDVDLDNGIVEMLHVKGGKKRPTYLSPMMSKILIKYMKIRGGAPDDYLFPTQYGKKMTLSGISSAIKRYSSERGIAITSMHRFRNTFGCKWLKAGGSAKELQEIFNHSTPKMTDHYVRWYTTNYQENFMRLNPLDTLEQKTSNKGNFIKRARN